MSDSDETVCDEGTDDRHKFDEESNSPSILTNWRNKQVFEKDDSSTKTPAEKENVCEKRNQRINDGISQNSLSPEFPLLSSELKRQGNEINETGLKSDTPTKVARTEAMDSIEKGVNTEDICEKRPESSSLYQNEINEIEQLLANLETSIIEMEEKEAHLGEHKLETIKFELSVVQKRLVGTNKRNQTERKRVVSTSESSQHLSEEQRHVILTLAKKQRHVLGVFNKYKSLLQRLKRLKGRQGDTTGGQPRQNVDADASSEGGSTTQSTQTTEAQTSQLSSQRTTDTQSQGCSPVCPVTNPQPTSKMSGASTSGMTASNNGIRVAAVPLNNTALLQKAVQQLMSDSQDVQTSSGSRSAGNSQANKIVVINLTGQDLNSVRPTESGGGSQLNVNPATEQYGNATRGSGSRQSTNASGKSAQPMIVKVVGKAHNSQRSQSFIVGQAPQLTSASAVNSQTSQLTRSSGQLTQQPKPGEQFLNRSGHVASSSTTAQQSLTSITAPGKSQQSQSTITTRGQLISGVKPTGNRPAPQTVFSSARTEQCRTPNTIGNSWMGRQLASLSNPTCTQAVVGRLNQSRYAPQTTSSFTTEHRASESMGSSQQSHPVGFFGSQSSSSQTFSLETLVNKGTLIPGKNVLTTNSEGKVYSASLSEKGTIVSAGGESFTSPRSWIKAIVGSKRKVKNEVAWRMVSYKKKSLLDYATTPETRQPQDVSPNTATTTVNLNPQRIARPAVNMINSTAALRQLLNHCRVTPVSKKELAPCEDIMGKDFWERTDFEVASLGKEMLSGLDF